MDEDEETVFSDEEKGEVHAGDALCKGEILTPTAEAFHGSLTPQFGRAGSLFNEAHSGVGPLVIKMASGIDTGMEMNSSTRLERGISPSRTAIGVQATPNTL